MKLSRIIYLLRGRTFLMLSLTFILIVNGLVLAAYISRNRNQMVLNPYVKSVLPLYRSMRDFANNIIDVAYVFQMRRNVGIPKYRLEVKTSDLQKLNEALPSSLSDEVIKGTVFLNEDNEDMAPGTFYYNDKVYDVKVGYRGLSSNHWTRPKKSWQVKFSKKTPFDGLRTLKLIIPDDRGYFAEALNNYRAQKLGLIIPDAKFVQLYVNNDYYGVYYAIEDFSSEFLEKNNKPADANIYATNDFLVGEGESIFNGTRFWRKESEDNLFDYKNFSELDFLFSQMRNPDFLDSADDIIDLENFYYWNIVGLLAGSDHQSNAGNVRLYFNNVKGKFEFLQWDVWDGGRQGNPQLQPSNTLAEIILSKDEFYRQRNQLLWNYVSNKDNLKDDLAYYDALYTQVKGAFYSDFKKHDNNAVFNQKVADIRSQYESAVNRTKELFNQNKVDVDIRHDANNKIITLEFIVDSFAGITLDDIVLSDGALTISDVRRYLHNPNETVVVHYRGNIEDVSKIKLVLSNTVTGEPVKVNSIQIADVSTFSMFSDISATTEEFLAKNPAFRRHGAGVALPAGSYVFNKDIVAPKNITVRIESGVTIAFAPDASFVSYSPIEARGTSARPIIFRPMKANEPWGSFAILNNGAKKSILEYVDVAGGSSDYINGSFISGMVSIYYSDAIISHVTISESHSDDGLNLKFANIEISNSLFKNNSADGLDLDYDSGFIRDSVFIDNGNDGIDLSGSKVIIRNNRITGSGDKCISIGENTIDMVVFNTVMNNCQIGVQVKDGSSPIIINSVIVNNDIGVNAYMKKSIYITGGHPKIYNSIIRNNKEQIIYDEFSDIKIFNSNVTGGYGGENNFDEDESSLKVQDSGRGNAEIIKQYLNINAREAPVGLWEGF